MSSPYNLVLVTGSMRSGTTLLQQVLCTAPDANPFVQGCRYLTGQIEIFARYAGPDRLFVEDYLGGPQALLGFTRGILERLLAETHRRHGEPRHLVLKNPELARVLKQAAILLPEARFVVSLRDPKDIVASMIAVGGRHRSHGVASFLAAAGRDIDRLCAAYRDYALPVIQALADDPGLRARLCFVRYESLVGETTATIARLSAFTGIALAPEPVTAGNGWRSTVVPGDMTAHAHWAAYLTALSGGPISATSVGRYREVLSEAEAAQVDRLCADVEAALTRVEASGPET